MGFDAIKFIEERWKVLMANPGLFILVLVVGIGGGLAWKQQEIANHESLMRVKEAEIAQLKERLLSLPAEPSAPATRQETDQLTPDEIDRVRGLLSGKPSYVEIMSNPGSMWSAQISSVFSESGWKVEQSPSVLAADAPTVYLTWSDDADTGTIKAAFDAVGLKYELSKGGNSNMMALLQPESD